MTRGEKIRRLRLGPPLLTQQQLGNALDVDRSMVAFWELGYRPLSPERAAQIENVIVRLRDAKVYAAAIIDRATDEVRRQVAAVV